MIESLSCLVWPTVLLATFLVIWLPMWLSHWFNRMTLRWTLLGRIAASVILTMLILSVIGAALEAVRTGGQVLLAGGRIPLWFAALAYIGVLGWLVVSDRYYGMVRYRNPILLIGLYVFGATLICAVSGALVEIAGLLFLGRSLF